MDLPKKLHAFVLGREFFINSKAELINSREREFHTKQLELYICNSIPSQQAVFCHTKLSLLFVFSSQIHRKQHHTSN